jgi:hypothetical protein
MRSVIRLFVTNTYYNEEEFVVPVMLTALLKI